MLLPLYRALTTIAAPAVRLHLVRRRLKGREDAARFAERLGHPGTARPQGPLVWIHAASVGEAVSTLPLIARLQQRRFNVLQTTGTVASAHLMADRLPSGAIHQYVPVDLPAAVRRFLDHWRPDLVLWIESELWPNLLAEMRSRAIPVVLINGRMSDRSFRRWQKAPSAAAELIGGFGLCLPQTAGDAARLQALGATRIGMPGNLKYAADPLPAEPAAVDRLRAALEGRPRWLAASTHDPEEGFVGSVHAALAPSHPRLLTLLVPRHPERSPGVARTLRDRGFRVACRSLDAVPAPDTDIFIGDGLGELGLFYRMAGTAFVGRSLVADGGHNPLEPARLGCAVVFGDRMTNFAETAAEMVDAGAAEIVDSAEALRHRVDEMLTDEALRRRRADAAMRFADGKRGVLDRTMAALAPFLDEIESRAGA